MVLFHQLLNQEEDKLIKSLDKVYNKIQRDLDAGASWGDIQTLYHKQTDDIIRSSVTSVYEISARKTVERNIRVPYYLTQQDLTEIKRVTQKYQDSFWLSLNREVNMRSQLDGVKTKYDPVTLLRVQTQDRRFRQGFIGRIAQSIHGEAAAIAVLSKARQVVRSPISNNRSQIRQHSVSTSRNSFRLGSFRSGATVEPHFEWVTADDETTCAECLALAGSVYPIEDGDIPIPSETTHPRCRCEIELVDAAAEESEIETIEDLLATEF